MNAVCNNAKPPKFAYRPIFRGTNFEKKACNAPLADKLAVAFSKIKPDDYILVSNDLNKEKSKILDIFTRISAPIRKLLFIKDNCFKEENLFFGCSLDIPNISTKPYLQNLDKTPKVVNMFDLVPHNCVRPLDFNDYIKIGTEWLEIKKNFDTDFNLEDYSSAFIKEYDFSKDLKDLQKFLIKKKFKKNQNFLLLLLADRTKISKFLREMFYIRSNTRKRSTTLCLIEGLFLQVRREQVKHC